MELRLIEWIQSFSSPMLEKVMIGITMMGETYFLIFSLLIIYYAVNKELGKRFVVMFGGSMLVNLLVKNVMQLPRPIGQSGVESIRVETATGYSFPSGHTQSATTLFLLLRSVVRTHWMSVVGVLASFGVGISRLYLGVHWPKDVLFGWIFAVLSFVVMDRLLARHSIIVIGGVVVVLLHLLAVIYFDADLMKFTGVMLGACLGFYLEERYINFADTSQLKQKIIRVVLGLLMVGATYLGLKLLFPPSILMDYIRYFIVGLIASGGVPFLFQRCSL